MTVGNFARCLQFVLLYEGGKSNDAHDPGGRTMEGVTQATYDAFRAKHGMARKDVFAMYDAERDEIYRSGYWDKINGDALRPGEDLCVLDFAVNSGPARAGDVWKRCGGSGHPLDDMIHDICAHRLSFLHALRTWQYFGTGWGRRVAACEASAILMAHGASAPAVLSKKAADAKHHSGKASTQATVGGAVVGAGAAAHYVATGQGKVAIGVALIAMLGIGIYLFQSWRHGQRADALTDASAAAIESAKQAQQAATAKEAIADLGAKPPVAALPSKETAK